MDFPKKQAQRLMPLYLLEYSEKLFTNHPDPSAPWGGGGGSDYTAGQGITITNNEISVDTNVIATKSDISSMVTTTQLNDALDDYALKTEIPTDVSQLYNDAGYATETWVQNQGYATSSEVPTNYVTTDTEQTITKPKTITSRLTVGSETGNNIFIDANYGKGQLINIYNNELGYEFGIMIDNGTIQGNNGAYFTYEDDKGLREYRLPYQEREGRTTCTLATNLDIPSLDGYATQTWVENQGYSKFSGSYNDLTDTPDLSIYAQSSNLSTVATTGSYNDLTDKPTIPTKTSELTNDSGFITNVTWNDITNKPTFATVATSGSYNDLSDKPYIFPSSRIVDIDSNQNITGIKTFEGLIKLKDITGAQKTSILPDIFDYTVTNPVTNEKSRTKFKLPTSKTAGTEQEPTQYTLATTDDIPTVNNPTITFTQGGTTKGTITLLLGEGAFIAGEVLSEEYSTSVSCKWFG